MEKPEKWLEKTENDVEKKTTENDFLKKETENCL